MTNKIKIVYFINSSYISIKVIYFIISITVCSLFTEKIAFENVIVCNLTFLKLPRIIFLNKVLKSLFLVQVSYLIKIGTSSVYDMKKKLLRHLFLFQYELL